MTKDELLALARERGVTVQPNATRGRIEALLAAAGETPATSGADPDEPAEPAPRALARWVDAQAMFVPDHGIVRYGDTLTVTVEQLASDPRLIPADDPFTTDPAVEAAARKEG